MLEYVHSLLTSTSLIVFVFSLGLIYAIKKWLSHPPDMPPMPCLPLPILGHTLMMKPTLQKALLHWRKKVGDIFTVYMGSSATVVISSYDLLHQAFVKNADFFSDRPKDFRHIIAPNLKFGIISNSGPQWKEQRSVSVMILRTFGMGKNILAEKIVGEAEAYTQVLESFKGEPKDIHLLTNTAVSNIICAILLGDRFDYNDPFLIRFLKINDNLVRFSINSSVLNIFPVLIHLPGDFFGVKKLLSSLDEMTRFFSDHFIEKFKDEADDTTNDNYIKAYLREMKKRRDAGENTYLDEKNLRRHIDNLFVAGSETTSTTILWSLVYVMNHPEVQRKINTEIDDVVGSERTPNLQDKPKMNYLNAFILETQRLGSIAPFGVFHLCTETTQVGGYTIPAGVMVIPHLDGILKDEDTWKDPEVFRPERFLDEDKNLVIPKEFLPFSLGRRNCLGESLAKMELFLFLSTIFHRFEILPEDATRPPSMEADAGMVMSPKPFRVHFKKRV